VTEINTRKFGIIIAIAIALVVPALGAWATQKITVEKKGTYIYWLTYKDAKGTEKTTAPIRFKGGETEIDLAKLGEKPAAIKLHLMDKRTGGEALVDVKPGATPEAAKPIDVKQDKFLYAPSVRLTVVSEDGASLESALVKLTDGEGTQMDKVLTPADNGVAIFSDVAAGDIEVKVEANGAKKTLDSQFQLPQDRQTPEFEKKIRVSGDVDTLAVATESKPAATNKQPEPASGGSAVLQTIVGLILLGIIGGIIYVVVKSKGFTAEAALKKMGVQIPEDQPIAQAPAEPAVDPNKCPFCGQMKDAAGNCACSVGVGASPFGAAAPSVGPSGPRLIGTQGTYSGSIFQITGSVIIGREPSNGIPLPNDTTASRRHASITASNGVYSIRDEGSSNGTFVNGARITDQTLTPGDEVQIGGTRFRFEV